MSKSLAEDYDLFALTRPRIYLIRMTVFTILIAFAAAILFPQIRTAFMVNPGLNGVIIGTLLVGIVYAFRLVWRLFPEVSWVNSFRVSDPGLEIPHTPVLLAPMATLLRNRQGETVLSPGVMRAVLDSIASRLDESREISRYLIGLLVFLGLLGTFWGLSQTVASVGATIRSLEVTSTEAATIFEQLKNGLEAPLAGMGTAFASSLFGLAGSLILGFLDLQAGQAQNRFYNDLEEWLSTLTDIHAGEGTSGQYVVPHYLHLDLREVQNSLNRINKTLEDALSEPDGGAVQPAAHDDEAIARLASAVQSLVSQMREEQKVVRNWAQSQADTQAEIKDILMRMRYQPERLASERPARRAGSPAKAEDL
ncbi:flagellar motor protein MotA [Rhodoligotrophos defluvii]|uniref:flagellar motor protein MotA n=1 Tax=Rhodoligotrophos defluvii TaxID=2561934 RepID=UPI001EF08F7F|nr:flagellar motor protein MotA [Rhodoligotrophos defluvii]